MILACGGATIEGQTLTSRPRLSVARVAHIPGPAAPEAVIAALGGAAAALDRGDTAAAERALAAVSAAPGRSLATLGALPFLPSAVNALALTERMWDRIFAIDEA